MKHFILAFLQIISVLSLTSCISRQYEKVSETAILKDTKTLDFPDTNDWRIYQFEDITFKAPKKWTINYHEANGYGLQIFSDYPDQLYYIKSERFILSTMIAMQFNGTKSEYCELFEYDCGVDLVESREWLSNARDSINWHIDTENTIYIEAIDGGEKTHSCYAYKSIDGQKYWFEFDGLRYTDDFLFRLTQEDCLTAVLILDSMQQIQK